MDLSLIVCCTMTYASRIREKISAAFAPCEIALFDESEKHAGHAGARPGGETHFRLEVISPVFEGLSAVERQRKVYGILADELKERVHALSLRLKTPAENTPG
jgi:BolA family transcriptional regulator, general stress-responsive regulator